MKRTFPVNFIAVIILGLILLLIVACSPEVSADLEPSLTGFTPAETGDSVSAAEGELIGLVDEHGNIEMRYHQVNLKGELMTGICYSKPEIEVNGKITLYENWTWTSGDKTSGMSVLEEWE